MRKGLKMANKGEVYFWMEMNGLNTTKMAQNPFPSTTWFSKFLESISTQKQRDTSNAFLAFDQTWIDDETTQQALCVINKNIRVNELETLQMKEWLETDYG